MLKEISAPDHVIALVLEGKVTEEGIQNYRQNLRDKLKNHARIAVYVDLTELSDITGKALIEGTRADMELLRNARQVSRCAFVSDKEWPQAVVDVAARLFPMLEMRLFPSDQKDAAVQWAADTSDAPAETKSAIRFLPTNRENMLAFEIDGAMSSEEMPKVIQKLEAFLANHGQVRMLNRVKHFGGFDPSILMQSGLFSMKLSAIKQVERYAIVGAPGWMRKLVDTMNPLFPGMDMQTFAADQEEEAWAWLEAELVQ